MTMSARTALVVGGGISGCVAAIALAQRGVQVHLIEQSRRWFGAGHGITVHGNALRGFAQIGVADRIIATGVPFERIHVHQADGSLMADIPTPRTGGPDLPATLGTLRAELQSVLVDEIRSLEIDVSLGTTVHSFDHRHDDVVVHLSDGRSLLYDLVVGADGIKSTTRTALGFSERPQPSGMGIWRFITTRKPHMDTSAVFYGGPHYKAGYAPISATECYAYVLIDPMIDNGPHIRLRPCSPRDTDTSASGSKMSTPHTPAPSRPEPSRRRPGYIETPMMADAPETMCSANRPDWRHAISPTTSSASSERAPGATRD